MTGEGFLFLLTVVGENEMRLKTAFERGLVDVGWNASERRSNSSKASCESFIASSNEKEATINKDIFSLCVNVRTIDVTGDR